MSQNLAAKPEQFIESLVNELLGEDPIFHPLKGDREGRCAIRREFVRAVHVECSDAEIIGGHCGNISKAGIELITRKSFRPLSKAIIRVQSSDASRTFDFVSECRWCIDKGDGGVVSGWSFLNALSPES